MQRQVPQSAGRTLYHIILWAVLLFIIAFLVAASFLSVDVVTRAEGRVIPSKRVQIIANLEGGIVRKIYVKQGDIVQKNQILMQLDPLRYQSEYQQGLQREIALKIKIAALQALVTSSPLKLDPSLEKAAPDLAETTRQYYASKINEITNLKSRYSLVQKEINLSQPLVKEGVMSTVDLLHLQQSLEEIQGNISTFNSNLLADLTDSRDKLKQATDENQASRDRLVRTTVRAPLYGVVKAVAITTEGGVVKPGDELLEIVPLDDTLLIEAKVRPSDIGFIHLNQKASVKLSAYDYSIYGGLDGFVENISADTFKEEKGDTYYLIWVRTTKNYLVFHGRKFVVFPGMVATVNILTGRRTLMHYILKPFMRVREAALIER